MPLSESFMTALLEGHLSPLRSFLCLDRTVSPEIRDNTLTVYYRGGRPLKLEQTPNGYAASFDPKYELADCDDWCKAWSTRLSELPQSLDSSSEVSKWLDLVPFVKAVMDFWFAKEGGLEREAQQLIVQENNQDGSYARGTDFFFCDMERAEGKVLLDGKSRSCRFDLVGAHWPSTSHERQKTTDRTLVIAEAKYGDGAHAGKAGIVDHWRRLQAFITESDRLQALKQAMVTSFRQKHQLGFIQCTLPLESFSNGPLQWLLILINHDPESQKLHRELAELAPLVYADNQSSIQVQVATSNFMGYGLWDQGVIDLDVFLRDYNTRVYSNAF